MQIASILSDLTSLRVCDHSAALALVTVHKDPEDAQKPDEQTDKDLQRARDLVHLHYNLKVKHMEGHDSDLREARSKVDEVLQSLEKQKAVGGRTA